MSNLAGIGLDVERWWTAYGDEPGVMSAVEAMTWFAVSPEGGAFVASVASSDASVLVDAELAERFYALLDNLELSVALVELGRAAEVLGR